MGGAEPKRLDERLDGLAAKDGGNYVWLIYVVRAFLNFTREEWESLSWLDQRLYLRGLALDERLVAIKRPDPVDAMPAGAPKMATQLAAMGARVGKGRLRLAEDSPMAR
jgi:hypothetical protein